MPKSVARPDVRANPAAGAQANAQPRHRVRRRALVGLLAGALLMVPLTACDSSGDGSTELRVAEAKVTAKQQAFTDAQADLKSKSDDFCDASADYLTALDRYGDVI